MGLFDMFRRQQVQQPVQKKPKRQNMNASANNDVSLTFADRQLTYRGSLSGYNYKQILRNKQKNIYKLYELADYYTDADPLFRGIIKQVYVPFSTVDKFALVGANDRVKQKYYEHYKKIHLQQKMESIFTQVFKYANCFIYLMDDGRIITLPVHYCRIGNVQVSGEPVAEFWCGALRKEMVRRSGMTLKQWLQDDSLATRLRGYPKQVAQGLQKGTQWVQLRPQNTFVLQDIKQDWVRYAVPMISGCLIPLQKKERISNYEDSLIDLAARSFVHVTYGDDKEQVLPTRQTLIGIGKQFKQAMSGGALAVTNHHAKAVVVQPKTDDVFANEKYAGVNQDILSAGGISGVIISGQSTDGSSFASAQVSTQTVAIRVKRIKTKFCQIMDKINIRLNLEHLPHSAENQIPKFTFPPVDLNGSKQLQESCKYLFEKGLLSHETLMDSFGIDMNQQVEKVKRQQKTGVHETLAPSDKDNCRDNNNTEQSGQVGRPTMDDTQRHSDPQKSATGRLPKASAPQGSKAHDDVNTVE